MDRNKLALVVVVVGATACKALPPPPVVAFHGDTASAPRDAITAMVVVGIATQVLGGGGMGIAFRVEHQRTDHTALGAELTAGEGSDDDGAKYWLFALRGYGRTELSKTRYVALTYGAGLSLMNVGLLTLTAHGGGATSYPNDYLSPFLGAGIAGALPLRRGRAWGKSPTAEPDICRGCVRGPRPPTTTATMVTQDPETEPVKAELFLYGDLGLASRFGGTNNQTSLDLGVAIPLRADNGGLFSLSIAYGRDFVPTATD